MAAYTQKIQQLYVAYFNRPADAGGLEYWESIVTQLNGDVSGVSAAFAQSAEYRAAYAGMTNAEIVNQVYLNLFGRPAEDGGKAYWSNFLDIKAITVDNVVTTVALGARGSDLVAYNAKVSAASAFTAVLQANPDPGGYAGMAGALAARDYISAVTDDASLKKAILPANLKDAIAVVKAASTPAATFNLTTGIDEIVPSSKNSLAGHDTFNANSSGSNQTINANDKIDGGAGKNALNINSKTKAQVDITSSVNVTNVQTVNLTADSKVNLEAGKWIDTKNLSVLSMGGASINAPSSANIKLDDTLGAGNITLNGGANISLNIKDTTGVGKISIGDNVAPTGNVGIISQVAANNSHANSMDIYANGNINIVQIFDKNSTQANSGGKISVYGGNATNSVSIRTEKLAAVDTVTITDMNGNTDKVGVLKSITADNVPRLVINNNALEVLNLSGSATSVSIKNDGQLIPTNTSLKLNLDKSSYFEFGDENIYKSIVIDLKSSSEILSLRNNAVTNLTVKGEGVFKTSNFSNLKSLEKISIEGNARLSADLSQSQVSIIDTTANSSTGYDSNFITIDPSITNYLGGAARDFVAITESPLTKDVSLGDGNDYLYLSGMPFFSTKAYDGGTGIDTIFLQKSAVSYFNSSTDFSSMFINFENLSFSFLDYSTIMMKNFGNLPHINVDSCNYLTLDSFANGGVLSMNNSNEAISIKNDLFFSGTQDSVNIDLSNYYSYKDVRKNDLIIDSVETINISGGGYWNDSDGSFAITRPSNFLNLSGDGITNIKLSGYSGVELKLSSPTAKTIDAYELSGDFFFSASEISNNVKILGSKNKYNDIDLSQSSNSVNYQGGKGTDNIKVGAGSNVLTVGTGLYDKVTFTAGNSLSQMTNITDPHAKLALKLIDQGTETFNPTRVNLPNSASLADYANAVIKKGLDASVDAALGWFQWKGDTYVVESLHNGITNPSFVDGSDLIVKLTGLHDLSRANFNNTETLTLA